MNSFFGIGFMELAFIAILALIVLGPERLPGAAREVAKAYQQIRNLSTELTSQFSEELKIIEDLHPQKLMNDLVQDTVNPPKKKAQPKTASKPLATKKPAKSETVTETAPVAKNGADADDAPVNKDDAAQAESIVEPEDENRILPPSLEESGPTEEGDPETASPSAVEAIETEAQQQTDKNA